LTREIYAIVEWLYGTVLADIQLPAAMDDFLAYRDVVDDEHVADTLDELLEKLEQRLAERRAGAWQTFYSDNPDHLSQAANSMVELLDHAISIQCAGKPLRDFLKQRYPEYKISDAADKTAAWISSIKDNLHATKHGTSPQSPQLTEALMRAAESVLMAIL
jgi:hypothetical protein